MSLRIVTPEILDGLPSDHLSAIRSRQDLRRVHRAMGTRSILVRALRTLELFRRKSTNVRLLEIGAGDGQLMLRVAQSLQNEWRDVDMTLLDQMYLVPAAIVTDFAALGWHVTTMVGDVLAWAADTTSGPPSGSSENHWDLIIANLFLHHFEGDQLATILTAVAARADCLVACEPRRSSMARVGSLLIGALGVNAVTRADAVSSVRAGFCDSELSDRWPDTAAQWKLQEHSAGLFSHCFVAERSTQNPIRAHHAASI